MMSAQHVIEAAGGKAICLEKRNQVTNEQVYHIKAKKKPNVYDHFATSGSERD